MPNMELGKLEVNIDPEALKTIVASGRLLEFADRIGKEASVQIASQLVAQIADAAVNSTAINGANASVSFIFDGGDFGTVPPRPKFGVHQIGDLETVLGGSLLRLISGSGLKE